MLTSVPGVGVTKIISPLPLFPNLSALCNITFIFNTWFKESNRYFCEIRIFACGEINELSFSNPNRQKGQLCLRHISTTHDDVIKWKHFPRYWPFVRGIHRSPVNSPHKGQWRGALIFSLIYLWINSWVSNREAGDFRRYRAHYDVSVMYVYGVWKCRGICIWLTILFEMWKKTWKKK